MIFIRYRHKKLYINDKWKGVKEMSSIVTKENLTYYHNKMKTLLSGKSNTNHTHNYAGSSSPGGGEQCS